jgi:hypothetical protein
LAKAAVQARPAIVPQFQIVPHLPDPKHVSTGFAEPQNLALRMSGRRFTRLANAFSKKVENQALSLALHSMNDRFCRIHKVLRVTAGDGRR